MKLIFPRSVLETLLTAVRSNPSATGVIVNSDELVAIYDELVATKNSNSVMISGNDKKLHIEGRWIEIKVLP
jgi:hypothetical protein